VHVLDRSAFRPSKRAWRSSKHSARPRRIGRVEAAPYEYEHDKMPIDCLAGSSALRGQIETGTRAREIARSWEPAIDGVPESTRALSDLRLTAEVRQKSQSVFFAAFSAISAVYVLFSPKSRARRESARRACARAVRRFRQRIGVYRPPCSVWVRRVPSRLGHPPENLTGCPPRGP